MKTRSQTDRILGYLCTGKPLTPLTALKRFGVFRLAARIRDLRKDGHSIYTEIVKRNGAKVASYKLDTGPRWSIAS